MPSTTSLCSSLHPLSLLPPQLMGQEKSPQYVVLGPAGSGTLPPPPPSLHRRRRSSSCRGFCYCCTYCVLFLLIAVSFIAFLVNLNPKPPSCSIDHLSISSFNVSSDLTTIHTNLSMSVRAENPNAKISFTYGENSSIVLAYRDTNLCSGKWPSFYHGYRNMTVISLVMDGKARFDQGMQAALHADKQRGQIPLDVLVNLPVQLRIMGKEMKPIMVGVRCKVVVDNLEQEKKTGIKAATCHVEW